MEPLQKLDPSIIRAICLQLDPFKNWNDQPVGLQKLIDEIGLKELYLEDPFKLTNLLLKSLHGIVEKAKTTETLQ